MTYNEWRDELKGNLLIVSESERKRVLDYYAEAYADRREAGFSEREIIEDFGAPFDAAQKILSENKNEELPPPPNEFCNNAPAYANNAPSNSRKDNTWVFVLLCILLAWPIFGLIMTMVGITIGLCVAPVAVVGSGVAIIVTSIGIMFSESVAYGFILVGVGVVVIGVGVILCSLFYKLVTLMWVLFKKLFAYLKSFFSGKERV